MKSISTYCIAFLTVFITLSCSSDDDSPAPPPTQAELIVGSWEMTSNTVDDGAATRNVQGIPVTLDFTWEGSDFDYTLVFTEDNQLEESGSFTIELTYNFLGQSITEQIPVQVTNNNGLLLGGEYVVVENELQVTNNEEMVTATIEELTETTLRLSLDIASVIPASVNELVNNASGTSKITFERQ